MGSEMCIRDRCIGGIGHDAVEELVVPGSQSLGTLYGAGSSDMRRIRVVQCQDLVDFICVQCIDIVIDNGERGGTPGVFRDDVPQTWGGCTAFIP